MSELEQSRQQALSALLKDHPTIAWPTVIMAMFTAGGWATVVYLGFVGLLPIPAAGVAAAFLAYWAFTPVHDATHRSLSKNKILNDGLGWLCGVPLLSPFSAFRYMHLTHHKYTNDPERDPDYWSGGGHKWTLLLRWLTQDFHYYYIALKVTRQQSLGWVVATWTGTIAINAPVIYLLVQGYVLETVCLILVPTRIAVAFLAATFDWLPHDPHEVESRSDRFRATSILIDPWLTPLFLFQNYHLIHHLYPAVPFYRYAQVWRLEKERLIEKGARVRSIVPSWRVGQPARR